MLQVNCPHSYFFFYIWKRAILFDAHIIQIISNWHWIVYTWKCSISNLYVLLFPSLKIPHIYVIISRRHIIHSTNLCISHFTHNSLLSIRYTYVLESTERNHFGWLIKSYHRTFNQSCTVTFRKVYCTDASALIKILNSY